MVIIFGLGFTGSRLAWRLLARPVPVCGVVRGGARFAELARAGVQLTEWNRDTALPRHGRIVVTTPPLTEPDNTALHDLIRRLEPARVVYISSTGVYGSSVNVDATTPPQPNDDRGRIRLEEERWMASGPWSSLILRSAAIYGPGRGVHAAIREGKMPRGAGAGIVSRIHVDDLAAIVEAGIFADIQGAWPVADIEPCSTDEVIRWCRQMLQWEFEPAAAAGRPVAGRRVDGRKIQELLQVKLKYPSWREGIPASLAEEARASVTQSEALRQRP